MVAERVERRKHFLAYCCCLWQGEGEVGADGPRDGKGRPDRECPPGELEVGWGCAMADGSWEDTGRAKAEQVLAGRVDGEQQEEVVQAGPAVAEGQGEMPPYCRGVVV